MSRQERAAKRAKQADAQAAQVVAAAVAKVQAESTAAKPPARRTRTLSPEHAAMGEEVKSLRDSGMAWWVIGHTLGLPGSADNVQEGKAGAGFARRIYASAYGEVPRTQQRNGSRANREKNETVRELKRTTKRERMATVRAGSAILNPEMPDAEVVDMLRGRTIGWHIDTSIVGEPVDGQPVYLEQEAGVHRQWAKIEIHGGERCLVFKTFEPKAPVAIRALAGPTRIVRLRLIHTVR